MDKSLALVSALQASGSGHPIADAPRLHRVVLFFTRTR